MALVQSKVEIQGLLTRLKGREITTLQVFGVNSLKSVSPTPDPLAGELIESTNVEERFFTVTTAGHQMVFDLQRTGKLVWLKSATPYVATAGSPRPTVRLILSDGQGIDLTEPARTKRVTIPLAKR